MKHKFLITAAIATITVASTTQSCVALATTNIGLSIIKKVMIGGITNGLAIFKDKDAFLSNTYIAEAMPSQLKSINSTLNTMGLSHLVQKEREYIADAAAFTSKFAEPILINGVNSLTTNDAARIAEGTPGIATQILKEKTHSQLVTTLAPEVDKKLNELGFFKNMNAVLNTNRILGSVLGNNNVNNSSMISNLATQQLVDGLFMIIESYEKQNTNLLKNGLKN